MLKRCLFILLILALAACSSLTSEPQDQIARLTLKVTDWSTAEAETALSFRPARPGLTSEVVFEIQDASGYYLSFDSNNKVSNSGQTQSIRLSPQTPSITVELKPGSYLISSRTGARSIPKRVFKTLATGSHELRIGAGQEASSPAPDLPPDLPPYFEPSFYVSAKLAAFDSQSLRLEGLELLIESNESSYFLLDNTLKNHSDSPVSSDDVVQSGVTAEEFWAALQIGKALAVEGYPEAGKLIARSLILLPDDSFQTGYMSLSGNIIRPDSSKNELELEGFPGLRSNLSKTKFYNEYGELEPSLFWSRASQGRMLMLDGNLSKQGFVASSVYLPAIGDEIPPLPDYLEGEIIELNSKSQSLRLASSGETLVKARDTTFYYDDRFGEITATEFWNNLALGDYLIIEGKLEAGTLSANHMYSLPKPLSYLEGQIQTLNTSNQTLKLYGSASSLIKTTPKTSYIDNSSAKSLTATEFWNNIRLDDFITVSGKFEKDNVLLAEEITKHQKGISYVWGSLLDFDQSKGYFRLRADETVSPANPESSEPNSDFSSAAVEITNIYINPKTKFILDYTQELSTTEFWQRLEPELYLAVEGNYEKGSFLGSTIYLNTYPSLDYLEGTIADFDQGQNVLSLAEFSESVIFTSEATFYDENGELSPAQFWAKIAKGMYLFCEGKQDEQNFRALSIFIYQDKIVPQPLPIEEP